MSILRTQSFLFTPGLLASLISTVISFSQAQLVNHVPQSASSPSPVLVNDVVYSMNHHSTVTMELSSFLSSPMPTSQSATIAGEVLRAVRVDVSGRDDVVPSSSDDSTTSLSGLDSSTVQPPPSASTLLLSPTMPLSPGSSTATSHDSSVPLSAIVGGAVGGCVVLVAFIAFIFVTRRQRSPHIEPFTLQPDVERHQPGEDRRRQMSQHGPPASDVPIIRPPVRRHGLPHSPRPLLHSGPNAPALYDVKVSVSTTSLHSTLAPSTRSGRTFAHNRDGDAASVVSHASSHQRRHRPLPRPPTDKPPLPPMPVPVRPLVIRRPANKGNQNLNATTTDNANTQNHALATPVPGGQSLASSAPLSSPVSPLDIDLGDYANPSTSPHALSPARRDSQLEPVVRSPRSLPAPPVPVLVPVPSPPVVRAATVAVASRGTGRDGEVDGGEADADAEDDAGPYFSPSFDAEGRPDSPSVAKMYAELLELQRQVARLREDIPCGARHGFGHGELEAPPEYAESVVGSVVGSTVCVRSLKESGGG